MKTSKIAIMSALLVATLSVSSCKECHECHYDNPAGGKVELGEFCDDDLVRIEESGHTVGNTTYEVHCHEH